MPPTFRPGDCGHIWAESDYIELNAALDYWCEGDARCRLAKEQAILSACEKGLNAIAEAVVALLSRLDTQRVPQGRPRINAAGVSSSSLRQQIAEGPRNWSPERRLPLGKTRWYLAGPGGSQGVES